VYILRAFAVLNGSEDPVKLALFSDIHANLEALTTALEAISSRSVDALYCLGDVVGYGADPAACVDLVQRHCTACVRGNHDEAVALDRGVSLLPRDGQAAALHNRQHLSEAQLAYLAGLPLLLEVENCTLVHAAPQAPEAWMRLDTFFIANEQFKYFHTDVCFVGHSHIPAVIANKIGVLRVRPGHRYLINVGSVGQPRDGYTRLCVAFFDTETFQYELVRVPYDVEKAGRKIIEAGLPRNLAQRLKEGR
jgi:predicted phosphodiesterase